MTVDQSDVTSVVLPLVHISPSSIKVIGVPVGRDVSSISIDVGDFRVRIPLDKIECERPSESHPLFPHLLECVELIIRPDARLTVSMERIASDFDTVIGGRPLVLSTPSQAELYAADSAYCQNQHERRMQALGIEHKHTTPISPVASPEYEPTAADTPYSTNVDTATSTSRQTPGGGWVEETDHQLDPATTYQSDTEQDYTGEI